MPTSRSSLILLPLIAIILIFQSFLPAEPPPLDITETSIASGLSSQQIAQIDARLKYWRDQIVNAANPKEVIEARKGVRGDYTLSRNTTYQDRFAWRAAEILTPLLLDGLKPDDKLLQFKQVNVGISLSGMQQVTIQPSLQVMVTHSNAAVRYLGWNGYQATRTFILAQSPLDAKKMIKTLKDAAAKEETPAVVGAIFLMADIPAYVGPEVPPETLKDAQKALLEIVRMNWIRWSSKLPTGNVEITRAFEKGVNAVRGLTVANPEPAEKGRNLQLLVDLLKYAAEAYDAVDGKGIIGKENTILLKKCETAVNTISQKRKSHIKTALTDEKIIERGAAVLMAVLNWADDLKDFGVVRPKINLATTKLPAAPAAPTP